MPCTLLLVALDFESKTETVIDVAGVPSSMGAGHFVWIDVDASDLQEARAILRALGLMSDDVVEAALRDEVSTQYARYDAYIHLIVSGYHLRGDEFELQRVSAVMGERFLITVHRGWVPFLDGVRRDYRADFVRFAKSPSFLVYELWDHLTENYLSMQKLMGDRVERLQSELSSGDMDDQAFARVSQLGADLLHFRRILLPARAILTDMSTRRSHLVGEATQRFLGNMVGTVDHLLQDLLVDRDILTESMNLYMSMVAHRTNQVMKKLTIVSVVFLPLTFLVGVYGMNFEVLPELKWHYGYLYFWILAVVIVVVSVLLQRGRRPRAR